MMTETEFEGRAAERESEQLMTQADAEDRFAPEHATNRFVRIRNRGGIGVTVGKKDAVRIVRENLFRAGRGR